MSKSSSPKRLLHFTLGPVQDFIADARRTRDFWAGSFILSLLSAHAMKAIKDAGGEILFPDVSGDELFAALGAGKASPYVGSLPNRFKADVTGISGDPGLLCRQAVEKAWTAIEQTVWKYAVADQSSLSAAGGNAAKDIWKRQVGGFWDMAWVVGEDPQNGEDGQWLDLRKNWRSQYGGKAAAENGDHCRMMGKYQEISGFHRIGQKAGQEKFWNAMRAAHDDSLDLQPDERLCAIALVKRFFPVVASRDGKIEGALPFRPGGDSLNIRHWPSTSYVAALPWLASASRLDHADRPPITLFDSAKVAFKDGFMGEYETPGLFGFPKDGLFRLDGHLLHKDGIRAVAREGVKTGTLTGEKSAAAVKNVTKALMETAKWIGGGKARHASEFYAILRMDGDGVGRRLKEHSPLITVALAGFTDRVKRFLVPGNDHWGVLVYAGGDDVLALLPVDTAIDAALKLREEYDAAFEDARKQVPSDATGFTLSGSIVYAHYKNPLAAVLRQSEHQLDEIAKETNGRNSLAIAVLKPGGIAAQWTTAFDGADGRIETMDSLAQARLGAAGKSGLSGGFFHGFRQKYEPLFAGADGEPSDVMDPDTLLEPLLAADIRRQDTRNAIADPHVAAGRVVSLLRPQLWNDGKPAPQVGVSFDAGMVARFLSAEGRFDLAPKEEKQ